MFSGRRGDGDAIVFSLHVLSINLSITINAKGAVGLSNGGEPGLVDRVLALHAGSRGFDSDRGTCPNDFSSPIDQDIPTQ